MKLTADAVSPYRFYWQRKSLRKELPHFPVRYWWPGEDLCEIEKIYFSAIRNAASLLDIGAGDLRLKHKFQRFGFGGEYDTQDVGAEFEYTYQDLRDVRCSYQAVLCLDVIEHLPLATGVEMLHRIHSLLRSSGVLVLQTPNARCIRNPLGTDMTHVHIYNLPDLWTYLNCLGFSVEGYRVAFRQTRRGPVNRIGEALKAAVASKLMGCDYADNIAIVARKLS
jgi:hypothetical protein